MSRQTQSSNLIDILFPNATLFRSPTLLSLMLLTVMSARWIVVLVGTGITGLVAAYLFYPVATQRINIWLLGQGDAYQVESARAALTGGGLLGVGPGSGVAKIERAHV